MVLLETLAQIDSVITQLKQARTLLEGSPFARPSRKSNLTLEGRRRIAKAVKRPWALQKETPIIEAERGWVTGKRPATHLAYQPPQL